MADISRDDLKKIIAFALHEAKVDDEFHSSEKEFLHNVVDAMHFSDEEKSALSGERMSLSSALGNLSSADAKALLVKTLCATAFADGVERPSEIEFIEKVNTQSGASLTLPPFSKWGNYVDEVMRILKEV